MSTKLAQLQKRCNELKATHSWIAPCRGAGVTVAVLEEKIEKAEREEKKQQVGETIKKAKSKEKKQQVGETTKKTESEEKQQVGETTKKTESEEKQQVNGKQVISDGAADSFNQPVKAVKATKMPSTVAKPTKSIVRPTKSIQPAIKATRPTTKTSKTIKSRPSSSLNSTTFPLFSLVCETIRSPTITEDDIDDLLSLLRHCGPNAQCDPCTTFSGKLARSLIRIASERIFAEPEQSIIEPVVNSIDAYYPESKIGKFGMGFFSLLYWISPSQDPLGQRQLIIRSGNAAYAYEAAIRYDPSLSYHTVTLTMLPPAPQVITTISILFGKNPLPNESVKAMRRQMAKLYYKDRVAIKDVGPASKKSSIGIENIDSTDTTLPTIDVRIDGNQLSVTDRAIGIPLPVLFGSLLVPSISTKGLTERPLIDDHTRLSAVSGIYVGPMNKEPTVRLLFLVGGVGIYTSSQPTRSYMRSDKRSHDFVIALPSSTKIPVSRDDLILDDRSEENFVEALESVLEAAIELNLLYELESLLDFYINYTVNKRNRTVVISTLQRMTRAYATRLVPYDYYRYYSMIGRHFVASKYYNAWRLRETLDQTVASVKTYFEGKKVIVVPSNKSKSAAYLTVSSIGLSDYLVVDENYTKTTDWMTNAAVSYYREQLIPYREKTGQKILDEWTQYLPKAGISPDDKSVFFSTLGSLWALMDRFTYQSVQESLPVFASLLVKTKLLDQIVDGWWRDLCIELQSSFNSQKGNTTYGSAKSKLSVSSLFLWDASADIGVQKYCYEDLINRLHSPVRGYDSVHYRFAHSSSTVEAYRAVKNYPALEELIRLNASTGPHYTYIAFIVAPTSDRPYNSLLPYEEIVRELSKRMVASAVEWQSSVTAQPGWIGNHTLLGELSNEYAIWYDLMRGIAIKRNDTIVPSLSNVKDSYSFLLSSLIEEAIYTEIDATKPTDLLARLNDRARPTNPPPLQIIQIAVNEGTTKSPIEASLTELLQNSIDALKESTLSSSERIIDVKAYEANEYFVLEVSDPVGMNFWSFIHLSIPFLSTKSALSATTGEMGSGFFNVYRSSSYVTIETIRDGVAIRSAERPIRASGGNTTTVVNIEKTVTIGPSTAKNGTTVRIFYPADKTVETITMNSNRLASLEYQLGSVFSVVDENIATIRYEGRKINVEKQLYWSGRFGENGVVANNSPLYEIYLMDRIYSSQILTKGVPFSPLENYLPLLSGLGIDKSELERYLRRGVVINILSGYSPVQTRTRIRTEGKTMKRVLIRALYLSFALEQSGMKSNYVEITQYDSTADPRQIRFDLNYVYYGNARDVFLHYDIKENDLASYSAPKMAERRKKGQREGPRDETIVRSGTTYASIVNELIGVMGQKRWEEVKEQITKRLNELLPSNLTTIERQRLFNLVTGWFKNKNTATGPASINPIEEIRHPTLAEDEETRSPSFYRFLRIFVEEYIALGQSVGISGYKEGIVSKVWLVKGNSNPNAAGWYSLQTKELVLSTLGLNNPRLDLIPTLFVNEMKDGALALTTEMRKNDLWEQIFSISVPASTVVHEIEHARRQSGGHDDRSEALWDGDTAITRSFDEGANTIYRRLIENGLYDRILKRLASR